MTEPKNKNPFQKDNQSNNKIKPPKFNSYWIFGIVAVILISTQLVDFGGGIEQVGWFRLKNQMIKEGHVEKIKVVKNNQKAFIYIKEQSLSNFPELKKNSFGSNNGPHFEYEVATVENFENKINALRTEYPDFENTEVRYVNDNKALERFLFNWLLPIGFILLIWYFVFRRMSKGAGGGAGGGNIFNVGKSRAKVFDKESNINVNFKDVAGLAEAKQEVEEIVQFLKHPDNYTKLGGKIPKGALLVGPPGTGKTLLAKAVAGEANVPFFSMSGSDFVEMFVGVGASRVRDLFKQAKEKSPCIVFIDEIDAIGRARGKNPNMGSNDERENTLNQLLTEMDGFETNSGVIILAATNRADILDRALMRAGRFDRQIHVDLPDLNERKEIFDVHLAPLKKADDVQRDFLAKQTPGFSGADIANVCNEAALIAARHKKEEIEKQDFLDAVDRIIGGLEKKNKIISTQEKKTIAYHEAGHATVSWLLENAHPLVKVTIVPRGKALGAAWYLPEERSITTKEQMLDEMCATLGGRAAEQLEFGKISTGAQNDLEKVTKQAIAMVSIFGMSEKIGHLSYYDSSGQSDYGFSKPYSEKTAEVIDQEVKEIVEESYKKAIKVLEDNREGFTKLSQKLLEKEVIFSEDLEEIFGKRKSLNEQAEQLDENKED
ncbi:MAG: ATP-dependent zinc metalloprotease FtsH [Marinifilaceae bacterium]|jgi:cell division protease FtsH|nr:ATP-dependent zinc metalloprotease FtsH [Marinifilaceae bacterium]